MRLPPITVLGPAERPRCKGCPRLLKPNFRTIYEQGATGLLKAVAREFDGWQGPGLGFCTMSCAFRFAARAYAAGFRWRPR